MGVIGISCQFQTIAIQNLMVFSLQLYHQSAHKFCHTNRTMQVQKNMLINQRKIKQHGTLSFTKIMMIN